MNNKSNELSALYRSKYILSPFGFILSIGILYNLIIGEVPANFGFIVFFILTFIGSIWLFIHNTKEINRIKGR